MAKKFSDADFIAAWRSCGGSAAKVSRVLEMSMRGVHRRRAALEAKGEHLIGAPQRPEAQTQWAYHWKNSMALETGIVIVYSDAHYWPGMPITLAFRALVKLCKALKPDVIVANGDLIDASTIGRFGAMGWERRPSMKQELEEMQARQAEIVAAAPNAKRYRTVGNHDQRLDRTFVTNVEQFAGLPGTRLSDFLPDWPESHCVQINDTFIKHRFRGGELAARNNVLQAGTSIVTGHLHKLIALPVRGYRPHRVWGVETGTLSDNVADLPDEGGGPFEYTEGNPTNWASGFVVLTYHKGALLAPEFCYVEFGRAWFRGKEV